MKRTDADEHIGNLFQDENLPTTAGTLIEETWLNSVQEELAQSVEQSGQDLSASSYRQIHNAMLRHGAGANLVAGASGKDGEWHPHDPGTENRTFWVDQVGGLIGEVLPGTIWLRNATGVLTQHSFSSEVLAAASLDSHTFTASKDTYLQIDADSVISFVETALAAGEPTPGAGKRNALKIVTDGSGITEVHSMVPAWPETRARTLYLTDHALQDRDTATEEGFRLQMTLDGGGSGKNRLEWLPWETASSRNYFMRVDDISAGGVNSDVSLQWSDLYLISYDGQTGPSGDAADGLGRVRLRTYDGSTAQNTRYVDEHTFAYDHDGGAATETVFQIDSPHDGCTVVVTVAAVDSASNTRCYGAHFSFLLIKASSSATQLFKYEQDPSTAGVDASFANSVADIQVQFTGEAAKTWRINGHVKIVPLDVTA